MASTKGKRKIKNEYENEIDISRPKKIPRTLAEKDAQKRLIVVLENASLETIKVSIKLKVHSHPNKQTNKQTKTTTNKRTGVGG